MVQFYNDRGGILDPITGHKRMLVLMRRLEVFCSIVLRKESLESVAAKYGMKIPMVITDIEHTLMNFRAMKRAQIMAADHGSVTERGVSLHNCNRFYYKWNGGRIEAFLEDIKTNTLLVEEYREGFADLYVYMVGRISARRTY